MILLGLQKSLKNRAQKWADDQGVSLPGNLEIAPAPGHIPADISLSWPLAAAKLAKQNPLDLADLWGESFQGIFEIDAIKISPPGFINLKLKAAALCANLRAITLSPSTYGTPAPDGGKPKSILIEFVSANPTGPLHLASGRGASLGDSLARILRRLGRRVHAEYYVNDAGLQVQRLGASLLARRRGRPVPEDGYHGAYVEEMARAFPPEADRWSAEEFAAAGGALLVKSHQEDMDAFGVSFDRWYRESELHQSKAVETALKTLKDRGMVYANDGAVWLGTKEAEGSSDDKDRVLVKANGQPTYFLADAAYHEDKYRRGFDELIDIFGADHHGYVPRLKAAVAALGHPPQSLRAIVHQLIHLYRGKEAVKMSKRAGEFVRLKEVMDEVGKDACRFFFALRTPDSHLDFDLELAKKRSSENPVYYCQYVHARICSIFREAAKQKIWEGDGAPQPMSGHLDLPEERALLLKLAWFPLILGDCEKASSPHPLATYILELAGLFHPFYEKCRVVDAGQEVLSRSRLALCAGVRDVIREGLGLIGVSAPSEM